MKKPFIHDSRHATRYLRDSFFLYDGKLVYCVKVIGESLENLTLLCVDHLNYRRNLYDMRIESFEVKLKDKKLNLKIGLLGFMNIPPELNYEEKNLVISCTRYPTRQWKFGLTLQSLSFRGIGQTNYHVDRRFATAAGSFEDMILGVYPSYQEAMSTVENTGGYIAFHRNWALSQGRKVWHISCLDEPVGTFGHSIQLSSEFSYLRGSLQRELGYAHC